MKEGLHGSESKVEFPVEVVVVLDEVQVEWAVRGELHDEKHCVLGGQDG